MQQLQAELDRVRRLATTVYDSRLALELGTYAAELERLLARQQRERTARQRVDV